MIFLVLVLVQVLWKVWFIGSFCCNKSEIPIILNYCITKCYNKLKWLHLTWSVGKKIYSDIGRCCNKFDLLQHATYTAFAQSGKTLQVACLRASKLCNYIWISSLLEHCCKGIADLAALREDESDASPAQQNDRTFPLAFFAGVRGLRGFLLCGAARCGEVSWSGYLVRFRFFQLWW